MGIGSQGVEVQESENRGGDLVVIDANRLCRRAYEMMAGDDGAERTVQAARYARGLITRLLASRRPTHVAAIFEAGGLTWRHEIDPAYRRGGNVGHESMATAAALRHLLEEDKIACKAVSGYGANDAIATIVTRWFEAKRGSAVVCSTAADLHVLTGHGALMWDAFSGQARDGAWVKEKFGVEPSQLPAYLSLAGDPGDGVPGVAKIGAKTAARLLASYGGIEQVMAGAGILLNAVGESLRKGQGALAISTALVQLRTDVQMGLTWKALAYPGEPHAPD